MQALLQKLQDELEESLQKNAEVAEGWKTIRQLFVPHELQREITEQQGACAKIIESKQQMIESIRAELRRKDDEYVRCLRRQAEDNELLLSTLNNQLEEVQRAHKGELLGIESAFLQVCTKHTAGAYFPCLTFISAMKLNRSGLSRKENSFCRMAKMN